MGPAPIPINDLNVERLSNAIKFMLDPEVFISLFHVLTCASAIETTSYQVPMLLVFDLLRRSNSF